MGRKKTTYTATGSERKQFLEFLRTSAYDKAVKEGLFRVRPQGRRLLAEWSFEHNGFILTSNEWFIGFVNRNYVFVNVMDAEAKFLEPVFTASSYEVGSGLGTMWLTNFGNTLPNHYTLDTNQRNESVYSPELMAEDKHFLQSAMDATDTRLFTATKLNDARLLVFSARIYGREREQVVTPLHNQRTKLIYLKPSDEGDDETATVVRVAVYLERGMHATNLIRRSYTASEAVTTPAMSRLLECKSEDEFYGVMNSNFLRKLKPESALTRYADMKNVAVMSGMGMTVTQAYKLWKEAKNGDKD